MAGQSYYNPVNGPSYMSGAPMYTQAYGVPAMPAYQMPVSSAPATPYMIQADGEMAARAWQMPVNLAPGTVIPIWDVDGIHVYFKSVDAYGRLNPTRKARIVFEDEQQNLPEASANEQISGKSENYVTKSDFDSFRNEVKQMLSGNRQNGSSYRQNNGQQKGGSENT